VFGGVELVFEGFDDLWPVSEFFRARQPFVGNFFKFGEFFVVGERVWEED